MMQREHAVKTRQVHPLTGHQSGHGEPELSALHEAVELEHEALLARYPFYWAARGKIHAQADHRDEARRCDQKPATLARSPAEELAFGRSAAALQIN
jgi:predicted RNA polymerase sigma factor